jgi:hypothetical protein
VKLGSHADDSNVGIRKLRSFLEKGKKVGEEEDLRNRVDDQVRAVFKLVSVSCESRRTRNEARLTRNRLSSLRTHSLPIQRLTVHHRASPPLQPSLLIQQPAIGP